MSSKFQYIGLLLAACILCGCNKVVYESIDPQRSVVGTVNMKEQTVSFVDLHTYEHMAKWDIQSPITGGLMLPDDDTLLLYGKHKDEVTLYSLSEGIQIDSWSLGEGITNGLLFNETLAFIDETKQSVRLFHLDGKEMESISLPSTPQDMTVYHDDLFVLTREELVYIDGEKKSIITQFPIHDAPSGLTYLQDEGVVLIGGHGSGIHIEEHVHVYDLDTGNEIDTIYAPTMPIRLLQTDEEIFVLSHGSNELYKLKIDGTVLQSIQIGANPFQMTTYKDELIVAGYDSDDLHFLAKDTMELQGKADVGDGPFSIFIRE